MVTRTKQPEIDEPLSVSELAYRLGVRPPILTRHINEYRGVKAERGARFTMAVAQAAIVHAAELAAARAAARSERTNEASRSRRRREAAKREREAALAAALGKDGATAPADPEPEPPPPDPAQLTACMICGMLLIISAGPVDPRDELQHNTGDGLCMLCRILAARR